MWESAEWKPLWFETKAEIVMWPHGHSVRGRGHLAPDCEANCASYFCQLPRERHTSRTISNTLSTGSIKSLLCPLCRNIHSLCTCSEEYITRVRVCLWIKALKFMHRDVQQCWICLQLTSLHALLQSWTFEGQFGRCRIHRSISFSHYMRMLFYSLQKSWGPYSSREYPFTP